MGFLFYYFIMEIVFDDIDLHLALAPFTLTRPVAEIRFGINSVRESWQYCLNAKKIAYTIAYQTEDYLHKKYPKATTKNVKRLLIAGNIKPTDTLLREILALKEGEALYQADYRVALNGSKEVKKIQSSVKELVSFTRPWHLFQNNAEALKIDFDRIVANEKSQQLSNTNRTTGTDIFIAEGAKVEHAVLNASNGPIYIGKNAEIMDGALIRGPFALLDNAVVKMGAKIYGATTIGPYCKVGGEISNSIFQGYSNKGHDGFLGNSVVGKWCNFGADTNSSNLKNNYSPVKIHSFESNQLEKSAVLFCGVLMGDHSKTGINTMLNTATVVGVSANIFGGGFPAKFIPSFTWGGVDKTDRFILEKAFEVAENMMKRRGLKLEESDRAILTHLYQKLA